MGAVVKQITLAVYVCHSLLQPKIITNGVNLSAFQTSQIVTRTDLHLILFLFFSIPVHLPAGSPSRGGDVVVYAKDINQPSLPTPFYSVLVSISVFMGLSTVFHSINSPDNSLFSHFVLPVLSFSYWSFKLHVSS